MFLQIYVILQFSVLLFLMYNIFVFFNIRECGLLFGYAVSNLCSYIQVQKQTNLRQLIAY